MNIDTYSRDMNSKKESSKDIDPSGYKRKIKEKKNKRTFFLKILPMIIIIIFGFLLINDSLTVTDIYEKQEGSMEDAISLMKSYRDCDKINDNERDLFDFYNGKYCIYEPNKHIYDRYSYRLYDVLDIPISYLPDSMRRKMSNELKIKTAYSYQVVEFTSYQYVVNRLILDSNDSGLIERYHQDLRSIVNSNYIKPKKDFDDMDILLGYNNDYYDMTYNLLSERPDLLAGLKEDSVGVDDPDELRDSLNQFKERNKRINKILMSTNKDTIIKGYVLETNETVEHFKDLYEGLWWTGLTYVSIDNSSYIGNELNFIMTNKGYTDVNLSDIGLSVKEEGTKEITRVDLDNSCDRNLIYSKDYGETKGKDSRCRINFDYSGNPIHFSINIMKNDIISSNFNHVIRPEP